MYVSVCLFTWVGVDVSHLCICTPGMHVLVLCVCR